MSKEKGGGRETEEKRKSFSDKLFYMDIPFSKPSSPHETSHVLPQHRIPIPPSVDIVLNSSSSRSSSSASTSSSCHLSNTSNVSTKDRSYSAPIPEEKDRERLNPFKLWRRSSLGSGAETDSWEDEDDNEGSSAEGSSGNASRSRINSNSEDSEPDRSQWIARALRRHPSVLELWERSRPIGKQPSHSAPSMPLSEAVFNRSSMSLPLSNQLPNQRKASSRRSAVPSSSATDSPSSSTNSPLAGSSNTSDQDNSRVHSTSTTEVADTVSQVSILKLALQHLRQVGLYESARALEEETGIQYDGNDVNTSLLRLLLSIGLEDDRIFEDKLHGNLSAEGDMEVVTGRLNPEIRSGGVYGGGGEGQSDIGQSWSEGPDEEGKNVVMEKGKLKGATINKLIERLTDSNRQNTKFMKTFLVTYRSFIEPRDLLVKLLKRYNTPEECPIWEDNQLWDRKRVQIKLRVGNVIKHWLENFLLDWTSSMLRMLTSFIEYNMMKEKKPLQVLGRTLRSAVERNLRRKGQEKVNVVFPNDPPEPIVPREILTTKIDLSQIDELEIARQLTLMDQKIFFRIKPWELLNQSWNKKHLKHRSPNVVAMSKRFNETSVWAATNIVIPETLRERKRMYTKFIRISSHLRKLNNFSSLIAILAAFESAPVYRMGSTKSVSKKYSDELEDLAKLLNHDGSYSAFRNALAASTPPCIPNLAVFLSDLVFTEEGNPNFLENSLVNWAKWELEYSIIQKIQQFQNTPYNIQPVHQIVSLIDESFEQRIDPEKLFDISKERE
eukprot:gb/GECH01000502.1/.p1 GENE.gb/GECH01000502.1/~~gb/GECH01000502.1/.p1  ORF type:complete len:780 (+),score=147.68 gb/GECH01000502.1/:1-2340(+)